MEQKKLNEILDSHRLWLSDNGGKRADLQGADLREAYLRGADLDYSCLPLWCGSKGIKVDKRIYAQILAHLCALDVDDKDCKKHQQRSLGLAKQSHRAEELGLKES